MKKKVLAFFLVLLTALSLLSATVLAAGVPEPNFNESFNRQTTALKNLGFTAPANYEINFPAALVEGVDYDYAYDSQTGDLTIVVKKGDPGHWREALNLTDPRIFFTIEIRASKTDYPYGYAINGNGNLAQYFQNLNTLNESVDVQDEGDTLRADSGIPLVTVNRVNDSYTVIPTNDFNGQRLLVAWADSTGSVVKREMVNVSVIVEKYFSIEVETEKEPDPIPMAKLQSGFSWDDKIGCKVRYADGLIDIQIPSGILGDLPSGEPLKNFDWEDFEPDGYSFSYYTTKGRPNSRIEDPAVVILSAGQNYLNEEYIVTWVDGSGGELRQKLSISIYDADPYWSRITNGTIKAEMPEELSDLTDWGVNANDLKAKGITITYDPSLGFRVSFDPQTMPDFETLTNLWLTAPAPANATSFSRIHQDSANDPRTFSDQDAANTWGLLEANHANNGYGQSNTEERSIMAFLPEIVEIDGIKVCVSASRNYRGMAVAWWNGDTLLRIDTIYGQNDDLVYKTTTDAVASLTDVVTEPIIVGEDLTNAQLECRRYPQTDSEAGTEFFQLALHGTWDPTADKTVVLPYSYFDNLTWEIAQTLTDKPVIHHYDNAYHLLGTIEGEYTENGIVFKTKTFSPFTVTIHPDKGGSSGGCYVATAVYGSYDCPEVWTLRRFRDETLAQTWYGRAFIHTYYAISPTLVKWFGDTDWFKNLWRGPLDKMVANLNAKGVADTPYDDMDW